MITVELDSVEVFGRHGVEEEERREGATFLYDISLDVPETASSDRLEDTVDYREVADCVREISDSRQFNLLEALVSTLADAILDRFPVERVRVRVRKPSPPGLPAAYSAASVERSR
jgi:7,8-dihydroneopterin aldolase/epimerase/oxygenase